MLRLHAGIFTIALAIGTGSVACVGSAHVRTVATAPRLIWIAPGVWVVENYAEAVFYYDGFYWSSIDDHWHRSDYYTSGFVQVSVAPPPIVRIRSPRRYLRYRAPAGARVRVIDRRSKRPKVRDHRRRR